MEDSDTLQFENVEHRRFLTRTYNHLFDTVTYRGIKLRDSGWDWRFGRSKDTKVIGVANSRDKMIIIWVWCFQEDCSTVLDAKDTMLHEMAHAFDYEIRGKSDHTRAWKDICIEIGAVPKATANLEPPSKTFKWNARCTHCDEIYIKSRTRRYPKKGEQLVHKDCRDKLLKQGVDSVKITNLLNTVWIKNF